jgi:hypothetical protein
VLDTILWPFLTACFFTVIIAALTFLQNENARQLVKLKGFEQTGIHFHSLLAETDRGAAIWRFREFVVFDGK